MLITILTIQFSPGNILEWFSPEGLTLDGIEFRAMMCGAHTVTSDFMYVYIFFVMFGCLKGKVV